MGRRKRRENTDEHDDTDVPDAEEALAPEEDAVQPKRTTSFVARLQGKSTSARTLEERLAMERERSKYWSKLLLLYPLTAVMVALSTIVFGGVTINAATNKCNAKLMPFLQGAVGLSHILVLFFAYCWMGPKPIKRLRTVRLFYIVYGIVCFAWWGLFGTSQAFTATASGFESCLSLSPVLYIMSMYEVAVFWLLLLIFIGAMVKDKMTAKLRSLQQQRQRRQPQPIPQQEEDDQAAHNDVPMPAVDENDNEDQDEQGAEPTQGQDGNDKLQAAQNRMPHEDNEDNQDS